MTTVVPGLVKIGKTGSENFEARMYNLERNGYSNVASSVNEINILCPCLIRLFSKE